MLRKSPFALLPLAALSLGPMLSISPSAASAGDHCDEVEEFWFPQCDSPPGSRARCHSGKMWPVDARPSPPSEPFIHRYHTAHYWPSPYKWQDRSSIRAHIEAQRAAGWMTATTLYEQHFDADTGELNQSGMVHLRWILLHVPPNRRTTWVQAGLTPQQSQARVASVQLAAADIFGSDCPPVMLRVCEPYGAPAQEVDMVRRSYLASWPVPRLATKSSGTANNLGGKSLDAGEGGP